MVTIFDIIYEYFYIASYSCLCIPAIWWCALWNTKAFHLNMSIYYVFPRIIFHMPSNYWSHLSNYILYEAHHIENKNIFGKRDDNSRLWYAGINIKDRQMHTLIVYTCKSRAGMNYQRVHLTTFDSWFMRIKSSNQLHILKSLFKINIIFLANYHQYRQRFQVSI